MCTTSPQALALFLGVVVLLVGEYHSLATRPVAQQPVVISATQTGPQQTSNDFSPSELAMSLVVNQITLLKMLNESSISCPLRESDLQELRDLKLELNATSEEVMKELQGVKAAATNESNARHEEAKEELRVLKETVLNEVDARNQEAKEDLQEVKEVALSELEEGLRRLHERMETALDEMNAKKEELKQELLTVKEQALNEVNEATEESKDELDTITKAANGCKIYKVFENKVTHSAAVAACKQKGGRLALPMNGEEDKQINQLTQSKDSTRGEHYWIGADDKQEEGKWTSSVTGWRVCYKNFDNNQPDNFKNNEDCLHVRGNTKKWNDIKCDTKYIYVCEFIE